MKKQRPPEPLARLISVARRQLKQATGQRVAAFGLSSQQFWVLVNLSTMDGPSLRALCDDLRMDAPTASRIVAALGRRGLVRSIIDPTDRRRMRLALTPKGRSLSATLVPIGAEVRGLVDQSLTRGEAAELRRLLGKVVAGLDRRDAAPQDAA